MRSLPRFGNSCACLRVLSFALLLVAMLQGVGCSQGLVTERSHGHLPLSETGGGAEVDDRSSAGAVSGLAPYVLRVAPWDPPVPAGPDGSIVSTAHYRIYTTLEDGWLDEKIPAFLETALGHYRTSIVELSLPRSALETYIFSERRQWQSFTKQLLPGEAGVYLSLGKGGFTTDAKAVLYDIGRWDTLCITAHEGWHQYAQAVLDESLPAWFDEGLATWMEGCRFERSQEVPIFMPWRNFERFNELRRCARTGRMYPLEELLTQSPQIYLKSGREHLLAYYAQVWVLIHFLMEGEGGRYRSGVEQLILDAQDGNLGKTLVSSPQLGTIPQRSRAAKVARGLAVAIVYFNGNLDELELEYRRFIEKVVARGSGSAIARGRSPLTIDSSDD